VIDTSDGGRAGHQIRSGTQESYQSDTKVHEVGTKVHEKE